MADVDDGDFALQNFVENQIWRAGYRKPLNPLLVGRTAHARNAAQLCDNRLDAINQSQSSDRVLLSDVIEDVLEVLSRSGGVANSHFRR